MKASAVLSAVTFFTSIGILPAAYAQQPAADDAQEARSSLIITEVELNPLESDERSQWIEVYNPTNKTLTAPGVTIKQPNSEFPNYSYSSVTFAPFEYKVLDIWDKELEKEAGFPIKDAVLVLYVGNEGEIGRTPALSDEAADSRTWQLNGTEWVLAEETPMRAIPEFGSTAALITAVAIVGVVIAASRYRLK